MLKMLVSIHVPLAEHDETFENCSVLSCVSIHVPLAEHDMPVWHMHIPQHQVSIHVPLAEHDCPSYFLDPADQVSIHVPLAEHDIKKRIS